MVPISSNPMRMLEVSARRVTERGDTAGEQLGEPGRSVLERRFHAHSFPSGCDSYKRVIYPQRYPRLVPTSDKMTSRHPAISGLPFVVSLGSLGTE